MTYADVIATVKGALGLPGTADERLLREMNFLRDDVCAETDWLFLRRRLAAAYAAPLAIPGALLGVSLVVSATGRIYYHAAMDSIPPNLGLRWWAWSMPADGQAFAHTIRLYDENGAALASEDAVVQYWVAPPALTAATVLTTELEFAGGGEMLITGLHGRWMRNQELRSAEQVGPFEQRFDALLAQAVARNPVPAAAQPVTRGGMLIKTGDRLKP